MSDNKSNVDIEIQVRHIIPGGGVVHLSSNLIVKGDEVAIESRPSVGNAIYTQSIVDPAFAQRVRDAAATNEVREAASGLNASGTSYCVANDSKACDDLLKNVDQEMRARGVKKVETQISGGSAGRM